MNAMLDDGSNGTLINGEVAEATTKLHLKS